MARRRRLQRNCAIGIGTIHKRCRQIFRTFDNPRAVFLILSACNFERFLTLPPPLPIADVVYGRPQSGHPQIAHGLTQNLTRSPAELSVQKSRSLPARILPAHLTVYIVGIPNVNCVCMSAYLPIHISMTTLLEHSLTTVSKKAAFYLTQKFNVGTQMI